MGVPSKIVTTPSSPPVARYRPHGLKATAFASPDLPTNDQSCSPLKVSQMRLDPGNFECRVLPAPARRFPSGLYDKLHIPSG